MIHQKTNSKFDSLDCFIISVEFTAVCACSLYEIKGTNGTPRIGMGTYGKIWVTQIISDSQILLCPLFRKSPTRSSVQGDSSWLFKDAMIISPQFPCKGRAVPLMPLVPSPMFSRCLSGISSQQAQIQQIWGHPKVKDSHSKRIARFC